jgi:hypothetical protein
MVHGSSMQLEAWMKTLTYSAIPTRLIHPLDLDRFTVALQGFMAGLQDVQNTQPFSAVSNGPCAHLGACQEVLTLVTQWLMHF